MHCYGVRRIEVRYVADPCLHAQHVPVDAQWPVVHDRRSRDEVLDARQVVGYVGRTPLHRDRVSDLHDLLGHVHRHVVLGAGVPVAVGRKSDLRVLGYLVDPLDEITLVHVIVVRAAHLHDVDADLFAPLAQLDRRSNISALDARERRDAIRHRHVGDGLDGRLALICGHDREVSAGTHRDEHGVARGRSLVDDPLHILLCGVDVERLVLFENRRQGYDDAVHFLLCLINRYHSILLVRFCRSSASRTPKPDRACLDHVS